MHTTATNITRRLYDVDSLAESVAIYARSVNPDRHVGIYYHDDGTIGVETAASTPTEKYWTASALDLGLASDLALSDDEIDGYAGDLPIASQIEEWLARRVLGLVAAADSAGVDLGRILDSDCAAETACRCLASGEYAHVTAWVAVQAAGPDARLLSTSATIYSADGYELRRGVVVVYLPATASQCATVLIGGTAHRADDLDITDSTVAAKAYGWSVVL